MLFTYTTLLYLAVTDIVIANFEQEVLYRWVLFSLSYKSCLVIF